MSPPSWVLASSIRLNLDRFAAEFSTAWSRLQSQFLKLECWQRYQEAVSNESQAAYERGDIEAARELLEREAEADRPLYEDIGRPGIEYARVRLIQEPLTAYLRYELMAYRIRERLGERIEVVRCDSAVRLPNDESFDCLLFDEHTALIHDYGEGEVGRQTGGWVTHTPNVIGRLVATVASFRSYAKPLGNYLGGTQPS